MTLREKATFSMAAVGDVIQTRPLSPYEGNADAFDDMLGLLRDADSAIGNLEVLVHDYEGYPAATSGGTYMRAPPAVLEDLVDLGFDLFSAATNHTFDFSHGGIETTLEHLRRCDVAFAGLGDTLFEARRPGYRETPAGRVGLVSAATTYTPGSEAGEQSPAMPGRPGLNPLGVSRIHRLPAEDLDALERISETVGIEAIKQDWFDRGLLYGHDWADEEYFHFGDMKFEVTDGEGGIAYEADDDDVAAFRAAIEDATYNADWVVASVHTHEGVKGLGKTSETPEFLVDVAHEAVDAGADAVVCHGPHVLRGVEVYRGSPVFYSLGNFVVQNETVSRLPPESFQRYGLDDYRRVSDVFEQRLYGDDGEPRGDLADERFWRTVLPVCEFAWDGGVEVDLYPCTLQGDTGSPQRGTPVLATGDAATAVFDELTELSNPFGTDITVEDGVGRVSVPADSSE